MGLLDITRDDLVVNYRLVLYATVLTAIILPVLLLLKRPSLPSNAPPYSPFSYPIIGAIVFFYNKRWDFFLESAAKSRSGNFSFHLGKHPVVGLKGEGGRKLFFESKQLDLAQGYSVLFGQGPEPDYDEDDPNATKGFDKYFSARIGRLMKTDLLKPRLPLITADARAGLDVLAARSNKIIDPNNFFYDMIFKLTLRIVGCRELAENPEQMTKVLKLYQTIEKSSTASALLFPYLPTPAMLSRNWAGFKLYMLMKSIADARAKSGVREEDALQYLLDQGDSLANIVSFMSGALYAGVINSSINAAAIMAYLAREPEWQARVRAEVRAVAAEHAADKTAPIADQLDSLPLEVWETRFPLIDMCLKDSIRLSLVGCGFRRNISAQPAEIPGSGGEVVPPGTYAVYHFADIHQNEDFYPDPMRWDPSRYMPGREEDVKSPQYAWAGWGQARHPCLGVRFAKVEQFVVIAYAVAAFDWALCLEDGTPSQYIPPAPVQAKSAKPPDSKIYVKYTQREKL